MGIYKYYEYLSICGEQLFTVVLLPDKDGRFPVVICRSPYVKSTVDMTEEEIVHEYYASVRSWVDRGYAVVYQHCRGQGKSTGAFVPYVHEREDGLALREWIRKQSFYRGELFLLGGSYTASLHYATAPFEEDVKGAVFEVQDSERYRLWYRNGQMRKGHANWHFALYKSKCGLNKSFSIKSFSKLPLSDLSKSALGECAEDFEQMLFAGSPEHAFWSTRYGGGDTKDAVTNADIPILLTTGYNDFYVGGVFKMWERMGASTKSKSAMLVSPYDHGDSYNAEKGVSFPNGRRKQAFGDDYAIAWFDNIRNATPIPFEKGKVSYYRTFEDKWDTDFYGTSAHPMTLPIGEGEYRFIYDPANPPAFCGEGLIDEELCGRDDVVSLCTSEFEEDVFVKGRMILKLSVSSDSPDTSFYARISIKKKEYKYVLRHDITALSYQLGDYNEGDVVDVELCFDEYAFLIKKGEALCIDVSSTDDNTYVCHTNCKGEYSLQTKAKKAVNRIYLDSSCLVIPVEDKK